MCSETGTIKFSLWEIMEKVNGIRGGPWRKSSGGREGEWERSRRGRQRKGEREGEGGREIKRI